MPKEDVKTRVLQSPTNLICSVKDQKEVSGPLGGISVEYIIEFNTSRSEYKTNFQSESAVVNFTISKTFKEIEYLYNKLKNQHQPLKFPDYFTKDTNRLVSSNEQRLNALDKSLEFIFSQPALVNSTVLLDFIDFKPSHTPVDFKSALIKKPSNSLKASEEDVLKAKVNNKTSAQKALLDKQPENLFGIDSGDEDDDEDLFKQVSTNSNSQSIKSSEARSSIIYSDEHLLFERQDLGGALQKHDKSLYIPVNDETHEEPKDDDTTSLEAAAELLQVDDSLSDILEEIQKKPLKPSSKPKPSLKPKPNLNLVKDNDKPFVPPRPNSLLPSRPVPPPRSTLTTKGVKSPTSVVDAPIKSEPDAIDILEYINKAESALNDNVDLF